MAIAVLAERAASMGSKPMYKPKTIYLDA